jgi:N-acetylglucosamine-6-sulfatase
MASRHLVSALAVAVLTACTAGEALPQPELAGTRPNILIIISDDQRHDTMTAMPRTQARIFEEGVEFTGAYATTPVCCPSRSSILTGMYAHNHGVLTNGDPLHEETFVQHLHEAGYHTGLVGKYLNSYPLPEDDAPLPEFDTWVAMASGSPDARYFDTRLNVDGVWKKHNGYQTYILRDYALEFLSDAVTQDAPFLLIFSPYAPHRPADPAPGDENLYLDLPPYRPPNYDEQDVADKPDWLQAHVPPLEPEDVDLLDQRYLKHRQVLNALDIAVEDILDYLEQHEVLDQTLVIYLSDNGAMFGEHRLKGKSYVYEPSIRVPFALRYPPLVPEPYDEPHPVANIDIAPTIYELAGIPIPDGVDGRSLIPLLQGDDDWRDGVVVEAWPKTIAKGRVYIAFHTSRYVYVEYKNDRAEFYDLQEDPYQLENRAEDPRYADVVARLKGRLAAEQAGVQPTPMPSR